MQRVVQVLQRGAYLSAQRGVGKGNYPAAAHVLLKIFGGRVGQLAYQRFQWYLLGAQYAPSTLGVTPRLFYFNTFVNGTALVLSLNAGVLVVLRIAAHMI